MHSNTTLQKGKAEERTEHYSLLQAKIIEMKKRNEGDIFEFLKFCDSFFVCSEFFNFSVFRERNFFFFHMYENHVDAMFKNEKE